MVVLIDKNLEKSFLDRRSDSKRSVERLPKAAQMVSVVNQFTKLTGVVSESDGLHKMIRWGFTLIHSPSVFSVFSVVNSHGY